jgi:hypothetical protein
VIDATFPVRAPRRQTGTWIVLGLLLFGALATAAATVVGNGNIIVAAAPVLLLVGLGVMWFAPIRLPLLAMGFLSLALDAMYEGPYNSPLAPLGSLLAINLNKSLPISFLAVPGIVVILGFLLVVHLHRRVRRLRTDSASSAPAANVLIRSVGVSLLAVIGLIVLGYKNQGDMQMAKIQVQNFILVLGVAYLFAISMRGLPDHRVLGVLLVTAACLKSLYAVFVFYAVPEAFVISNGAYATTHGDSMLFASATVLLIVMFAEQPVRRYGVLCAILLPLLMAGMVANSRRLVWVEVAAGLVTFWLISRRSKLKRVVIYAMVAAFPLFLAYVAVGWNSGSKVFAPVKLFRSVGDSKVDNSTLYRDLENYDLLATMRINPIIGSGFGHPFAEPVTLPDISFFREFRYMPHNSILGLWAFAGPVGFSGLWFALVVGVYLAARSYRYARVPEERVGAFMVIAAIVIFAAQCCGDIGFSERKSIFLVGPALAVAGQLALATGAWRTKPAKPAKRIARSVLHARQQTVEQSLHGIREVRL